MDIVFGTKWFEKHQQKLLWLLNAPVIKIWFRWILRIRKYDLPLHATIVSINPNSFTVVNQILKNGQPELKTDFRTHDKFAKRLYYAFKPLWYLFHIIDWVAFDRYEELTKLSFGFSTLTQYPGSIGTDNPVDGKVWRGGVNESWSTIRAGAGTGNDYGSLDTDFIYILSSGSSNVWQELHRSIFCFDTSSIGSTATISATVMSLYGSAKYDDLSTTPNIDIYTSTPASTTSLANSDYGNLGTTSQTGSPITYSSWNTSGYNDFTFNSTGIGNVSKTGTSKFGARNANYDVANTAPNWVANKSAQILGKYSNQTGTTQDPKLVVTYSSSSIKTVNGLAIANTKTVNGLATGSIKTIMGLG